MVSAPRIVGYLFGLAFLYGVWLLEPRWIAGALGLIVLYVLITNVDRVAVLTGDANSSLRGLIKPRATAAAAPTHN